MNPETYAIRRDELVALLEKTSATLGDLMENHADLNLPFIKEGKESIDKTCKRVYEDQFKIALVARFQGGKSTTFNALTGGEIISPIGDGAIKCSASRITAFNVDKDEEVGTDVIWRTDDQLKSILEETLKKQAYEINRKPGNNSESEMKKFWHGIDLRSKNSIDILKDTHRKILENWKENKRSLSDDERDMLFTAGIILNFLGSQGIKNLIEKTYHSNEIGKLISFPNKFQIRYEDGDASVFHPEEVAFPFIDQIICRVKSLSLRRIGAAVTDCPGLYASRYDTDMAMDIISRSDAVWFLTDGQALGESDLRAIKECWDRTKGTLFISVNLKANTVPTRENIVNEIIPHQLSQIRQTGVNLKDGDLRPYHALCALLSAQGGKLLNGSSLNSHSSEKMKKIAAMLGRKKEFESDSSAWEAISKSMLNTLQTESIDEFLELNPKLSKRGLELVRNESEINEIVEAIETYVVMKRSESILINNGASPAIKTLKDGVSGPLQEIERNAFIAEEEARREAELRRSKLVEFQEFCNLKLEKLSDDAGGIKIDAKLAEDLYDNVILKNLKNVTDSAAPRIRKDVGVASGIARKAGKLISGILSSVTGGGISFDIKDNQDLCTEIIKEEFESNLKGPIANWIESCNEANNQVYRNTLQKTVFEIKEDIDKQWEKVKSEVPSLKTLPDPTLEKKILSNQKTLIEAGVLADDIVHDQFFSVMKISGSVGWAVTFILAMIPGIGWLLAAVVGIVSAVITAVFWSEEDLIRELSAKLHDNIRDKMNENKPVVIEKIKPLPASMRHLMQAGLKIPLEKQKIAFESDCKRTEASFRKSQAERERIGRECHQVRINKINPLLNEIESFIASVKPQL